MPRPAPSQPDAYYLRAFYDFTNNQIRWRRPSPPDAHWSQVSEGERTTVAFNSDGYFSCYALTREEGKARIRQALKEMLFKRMHQEPTDGPNLSIYE